MTKKPPALSDLLKVVEANPYKGTTQQIITLSLAIEGASSQLDRPNFVLFREETGINEKIFSKLKIIGKTLSQLNSKEQAELIKNLPPSYSTIHYLCALKPDDVVSSVRTKNITRSTSVTGAKNYVKQIRFPQLTATEGQTGRWNTNYETLWSVLRPEETPLEGEALQTLENELRRVCEEYGVVLRKDTTESTITLRQEDWKRYASFWRGVLEKELTNKWFKEQPDELKKQFNLKTIDELRDTPLRGFTGFLIKANGGREMFWEKHGNAYVARVCFLMGNTEDTGQRYNLKRRLEQVLGDRRELAIWHNLMLKNSGITQPI